ncbi:MAG: efflux RND transporter periplasmic adaptor subunit [Acidobacteriota bacterium]|nr:efflux RND transporter periplasmic adaptor subunit [Acidobacteriota bacterium]
MTGRASGIVLAALVAAGAALAAGCQDRAANAATELQERSDEAPSPAATPVPRVARVRVRTEPIETTTFVETIEVSGTIAPWKHVVVSSELGGLVREVGFDKGRRVAEGQLLARVGDDLADARLDGARAELKAAAANHEQAERLFERQAVPEQRLIDATAALHRARARVREHELLLARSLIRAPISGVAVSRDIEPGEVIPPSTIITTLQRVDRLKVTASVPDTEVGWLSVGRPGRISVDAYEGQEFDGKLSYVAPAAQTDTRGFPIEVALDNRGRALRPGLVARIRLDKRRIENAIVVPFDALVTRTDGTVAYVVDDCAAHIRPVEVAAFENDRALIESGLAAGDLLVVDGQADLIDGQPIVSERCP